MATVALIVGAAIVNAIAFTVGNALYDKFEKQMGQKKVDITKLLRISKKRLLHKIKSA